MVRLVRKEDKFCDEFCYIHRHRESSIAEALADKIPQWTAWVPILIWAATGFGKTFFVLHHLVPYVLATGGRLLLVSNRLASSVQQKRELMKLLKHYLEGGLNDLGLQRLEDFGPVRIMTLQKLQGFINSAEGREWCKGVTHLVVDEAHFFTSDFLFNQWTGALLHQIPQVFCHAVRVYMTATPEEVLYPLAKAEEKASLPIEELYRRYYQSPPYVWGAPEKKHLEVHQFAASYDHIRLRYFRGTDELVQAIQAAPDSEKWLVFISSIKKGEALCKKLASKIGEGNVCLVTADDKGGPTWSTIVNEERLHVRVVLTTAVLDCGTNIVDPALKNVVIFTIFHTEFMQALGRKRCKNDETFTLFVPTPNPQYLSLLRGQISRQRALVRVLESGSDEEKERVRRELWNSDEQALKSMVWFDGSHPLRLNDVAAHAVRCRKDQLDELEKMTTAFGDEAFPRIVHKWLRQEDGYREDGWLGADRVAECRVALLEYLEGHCNEILPDDEKKRLQDMILRLLKLETNRGNRRDRPQLQHGALNHRLIDLHIPFWIENARGKWTVRRCGPTDADDEIEL